MALVAHGLSAMSVYIDVVFVRILFGATITAAVTLLCVAAAVFIKFATPLAIPGWATTVVGLLGLMLMQIAVMAVAMLLLVLAGRNGRPFVPIADADIFVAARQHYQLEPPSPPTTECGRAGYDEPQLSGNRA